MAAGSAALASGAPRPAALTPKQPAMATSRNEAQSDDDRHPGLPFRVADERGRHSGFADSSGLVRLRALGLSHRPGQDVLLPGRLRRGRRPRAAHHHRGRRCRASRRLSARSTSSSARSSGGDVLLAAPRAGGRTGRRDPGAPCRPSLHRRSRSPVLERRPRRRSIQSSSVCGWPPRSRVTWLWPPICLAPRSADAQLLLARGRPRCGRG